MGLEVTLHKAAHLCKFDVNLLNGMDRQVIKRVWRIGQPNPCHVWRLSTVDNTEEVLIKLRQEIRGGIVQEAYKLSSQKYDVDDEDDEDEEIGNVDFL